MTVEITIARRLYDVSSTHFCSVPFRLYFLIAQPTPSYHGNIIIYGNTTPVWYDFNRCGINYDLLFVHL